MSARVLAVAVGVAVLAACAQANDGLAPTAKEALERSAMDGMAFAKFGDWLVPEFEAGMPIPHVVHQLWLDAKNDVPSVLAAQMRSWKDDNPSWEHRVWNEEQVEQLLQGRYPWLVAPMHSLTLRSLRDAVAKYMILDSFGGVVVDVTSESVAPLQGLVDRVAANNATVFFTTTPATSNVSPLVMGSAPGHVVWNDVLMGLAAAIGAHAATDGEAVLEDAVLGRVVDAARKEHADITVLSDVVQFQTNATGAYVRCHWDMARPATVVALQGGDLELDEFDEIANLNARAHKVVEVSLLLSLQQPYTKSSSVVVDTWAGVRAGLVRTLSLERTVHLVEVFPAQYTPNAFVFRFDVKCRQAFVTNVVMGLHDAVDARLLADLVHEMGTNITDAVVLETNIVDDPSPNVAERTTTKAALEAFAPKQVAASEQAPPVALVAMGGGGLNMVLSSESELCRSDNGCACCCASADPHNSAALVDCVPGSAWVLNGTCPPSFPYSTPSVACTYPGNEPWPPGSGQMYSAATHGEQCSKDTKVEDLHHLCRLTGCDNGVTETCGCLDKYLNNCFAVNNSLTVMEPCDFTRDMARGYFEAKGCKSDTQCMKPWFLSDTPLTDDCAPTAAVGDACNLTCAAGFKPENPARSFATIQCSSAGWEVVRGGVDCVEVANCSLSSAVRPESSVGVVHDCEDNAPIGTGCTLMCRPGFTSSSPSDSVHAFCEAVSATEARYNASVSCTPTTCSPNVIPPQVVHDCVNGSIGSTCTLNCPKGFVGLPMTARCVGHGGKGGVKAYAEYDFGDLVCEEVQTGPDTTLASVVVKGVANAGAVELELTPNFSKDVLDYSLKVPFRFTKLWLRAAVDTVYNEVTVLCADCAAVKNNTAALNVGTQHVKLLVTSKVNPLASTTYNLYVVREPESPNAVAAGDHFLHGVIRVQIPYESDWEAKYGYLVKRILSSELGVPQDSIEILSVLPGSVLVEFVVHVPGERPAVEQVSDNFDQAMATSSLRGSMCRTNHTMCPPSITAVAPLAETQFPTTPQRANATDNNTPQPAPHTNTTASTAPANASAPAAAPTSPCARPAARECMRRFVEDNSCLEMVVDNDCDQYVACQRMAAESPNLKCKAAPCELPRAKECVVEYVQQGCGIPLSANNCDRFYECQRKARDTPAFNCPARNPWSQFDICKTDQAVKCVEQFAAGGCLQAVITDECRELVECQREARDKSEGGCPQRLYPFNNTSAMLYMHMMLVFRFHVLVALMNPHLAGLWHLGMYPLLM